jgi:hypothetical protein
MNNNDRLYASISAYHLSASAEMASCLFAERKVKQAVINKSLSLPS